MSAQHGERQTATAPHHRILSMEIAGGFFSGVRFDFSDGLNCIIGGRGSGKTTALEFLRFGLGLMPDAKKDSSRFKNIQSLVDSNLGNATLAVQIRTKTGMTYTVKRSSSQRSLVCNEDGDRIDVSLDRDLIFGADIYSQNQIEEIAAAPAAQLELIDRFAQEEMADFAKRLEVIGRGLEGLADELRRLDGEHGDQQAVAVELPALEQRLLGLAPAPEGETRPSNLAHARRESREREKSFVSTALEAARRVSLEAAAPQLVIQRAAAAGEKIQQDPDQGAGPNDTLLANAMRSLRDFSLTVDKASASIRSAAALAEESIEEVAGMLADKHAAQEAEYALFLAKSKEAGGQAAERNRLQARLAAAQTSADAMTKIESRRRELRSERARLLQQASEIMDERFTCRARVANRLTELFDGTIRVQVSQAEDTGQYEQKLADALSGLRMQRNVVAERIARALLPAELAELVSEGRVEQLVEKTGLDKRRAISVMGVLSKNGLHYEVEAMRLEDVPIIELLDGETYKGSSNLSTGQRCTTVLPILLVQSERPLLIDQPEDNLDNAFIYNTVVTALQQVKSTRQVIFVTHNPNIPVLGDAEQIFVLHSTGTVGKIAGAGTVDDCKEQIETILEGGRAAFAARKQRYGH